MTEQKSASVVLVSREQFLNVLMERMERKLTEEAERLRKESVAKRYYVEQ